MCETLADINCANDLRLHIRLDKEPDSLLEANEIKNLLKAGLRLNLPTPTLVGLPIDEAGYELLYTGYAVQVVTAVLAHQTEYDCCTHQLIFRVLRDYQLDQLGLQPWPLAQADFDALLTSGYHGNASQAWSRRWEVEPAQIRPVYALVDYLVQRKADVSVNEMLRLSNKRSYPDWLRAVLQVGYDENLFAAELLQYILDQSQSGQAAELPVPLPEQTLRLVCSNYDTQRDSGVYEYNFATGQWSQTITFELEGFNNSSFIQFSPNGEEAIMLHYNFEDGLTITQNYLIVDGELYLLEENETENDGQNSVWVNYIFGYPKADYLVRSAYYQDAPSIYSVFERDCILSGCVGLDLPGWPNWSPNGEHVLVEARLDTPLDVIKRQWAIYLYDLPRQVAQVGEGMWPFWLSNDIYGFIQTENENWVMVTAVLGEDAPRPVVDLATFLAEVAEADRPESLTFRFAAQNPQNPQEFLLVMWAGIPGNPADSYIFKLLLDQTYSTVLSIEYLPSEGNISNVAFSPDGRFITEMAYPGNSPAFTMTLIDQENGEQRTLEGEFGSLAWTPDGRWLAQSKDNFIMLHAPAHDYQYLIPHGLQNCFEVGWGEN